MAWSAVLVAALLLATFGMLEVIAHRPSPVRATVSRAEIDAEDIMLKQSGLVLKDGGFLKEHPFEPPWTSHSLLVPLRWSQQPVLIRALLGSRHVRADLLRSDLDVLEPVMERAYGGWDTAAARGWNWTQWFNDWRNALARRGSAEISLDEAFAPVDALLAFQRDNHTNIPLNRLSALKGDGSQTAVLGGTPSEPCVEIRAGGRLHPIDANDAGRRVRMAKLWRVGAKSLEVTRYISMPSSFGTPQAVRCGGDWVPLEPVAKRGMAGVAKLARLASGRDRTRIERMGYGVVYARLPTFTWSNYENVSRTNWARREPGDRVLIVDLRANDGGSFGYGFGALKGWIDEKRVAPWGKFGKELTTSCLYGPLRWNEEMVLSSGLRSSDGEFLQGVLDRMAQPYPTGCPRSVDTEPPQWAYQQRHFDPAPGELRIIALVDSGCGSDCELFTAELASLPDTIVVGANTFGVGQFIQPGYSVLPNTKLQYRISLGKSNLYGDDRSFDGYGLDVDVVVPAVDRLTREQLQELAEVLSNL